MFGSVIVPPLTAPLLYSSVKQSTIKTSLFSGVCEPLRVGAGNRILGVPTLPVQVLNIITACWEVASARGEGGCVAWRGIGLDCVFTIPIDLHSEKETQVLGMPLPGAVLQLWGYVAWVRVRSGLSSGSPSRLSRQSPGSEQEESNKAALQALDIC